MKFRYLSILMLLTLTMCRAGNRGIPEQPEDIAVPPLAFSVPDASSYRSLLPTGTPFFHMEDRTLPLVELQILFRGGSDWDPADKEGTASLFADLLRSGGTVARSPKEVDEELDFLAADVEVSIRRITGTISLSVLNDQLEPALKLLFEMIRTPGFDDERLALAKSRMQEGLKTRNDSSRNVERREAPALFKGPQRITRLPRGKTVTAIKKSDLKALAERTLHPKNFLVTVSGAISRSRAKALLTPYLADWPHDGTVLQFPPDICKPAAPGVYLFPFPGAKQGRIIFGHLGVPLTHPDAPAISLMSYIYGSGGFSSRLLDKVRTQEGLAYAIWSDFRCSMPYVRPFQVIFQTKAPSSAYAIRLSLEVIKEIQEKGVTAKELKAAKDFFVQGFPALFFSSPDHTLRTFAWAEMYGYPSDYYMGYRDRLQAVTLEDVRRAAKNHFRRKDMIFCIVGDAEKVLAGDGQHPDTLSDFGEIRRIPLSDPVTLKRPK